MMLAWPITPGEIARGDSTDVLLRPRAEVVSEPIRHRQTLARAAPEVPSGRAPRRQHEPSPRPLRNTLRSAMMVRYHAARRRSAAVTARGPPSSAAIEMSTRLD